MRRVKKLSIANYIVMILVASELLMALFMLFFFYYYSDVIRESEIRKELIPRNKQVMSEIDFSGNEISYDWKEIYEETEIYVMIYCDDNMIEMPDMPEFLNIIQDKGYSNILQKIKINDEIYYFKDFKTHKNKKYDIYLRYVVNLNSISSHYISTIRIGYVAIIMIVILISTVAIITGKYLKNAFKKMKKEVESVGQMNDISKRIAYDGIFAEMQILCDAENRMLDRMENNLNKQKQYISDVSHELRTPISVIMAQAEYGEKQDIPSEDRIDAFSVIKKQSYKMNELVMTLLELSRLDQENYKIMKEDINFAELASFVCEGIVENTGQEVHIKYECQPAYGKGDIHLLSIAISNLVTNAIKYSEPAGTITVSTGETDTEVYIRVKDEGIGIRKENLKMIFERFYKAEKSRHTKGYGLGLPLSQRIAQLHDGYIAVESEEGKGSTFTIFIKK